MKNKKYTIADMAELIAKQEKKFATNPRALKKLAQAKQMLMQTNDAKRNNNGGSKFEDGGNPFLNLQRKNLFDYNSYDFPLDPSKQYLNRTPWLNTIPGVDFLSELKTDNVRRAQIREFKDNTDNSTEKEDRFLEREANRDRKEMEKLMGIKTKAGKRIDTIKEEFKNNPNLATGIFQGAAMIGDFANQMSAIKDMKEPNKVALAPQARLNKNMDTSAYRNDANRAFRTQNMIANNAPNQSVGNAMRGNIMGQYLNSLGQVNTAANNYRSQMENQEAGLNASINIQNAGIMNDFYSAKNQFANNKRMAKANAFSGLLGNAQLMTKDYRQQAFDKNVRYPMMSKWASAQSQAFLNS